MSAPRPRRIFHGWWIVLVSMLAISTGVAPFGFASFGLFMGPLGEEFGWSRAQLSFALTYMLVSSALCMPLVGLLIDRYRVRIVLLPSMLLMGACLITIPLVLRELWQLCLLFALVGSLGAGNNTVSFMPVLSAWFNRRRGLAIGIAVSGIGLGFAYVPALVQLVIDHAGWRAAYVALGALLLGISSPLVYALLKENPAELGLNPDGLDGPSNLGSSSRDVGLSRGAVFRTREFWMLAAIFCVLSFVLYGLLAHLVPMLRDRGMGSGQAAAVASTLGATMFVSRILIGFLVDRYFAPTVATVAFAGSALGVGLFALGAAGEWAYLAAVLIGFSIGAEVDLLAYMSSRYFGLRAFGTTCGVLLAAIVCGSSMGPPAFGLGFEATGSYASILTACVLVNVVVLGLTAALGPYPDWDAAPTPET